MKTLKFISVAAAALLVIAGCGNSGSNATKKSSGKSSSSFVGNGKPLKITNDDGSVKTIELPDKALTDSVSYLVGLNFGYFIKANNFGEDLNYNKIREGMMAFIKAEGNMNDPAFNDQFKIGPDKMNALFNSYLSARREYEAEYNKQEGHKFLEANKQNAGVVVTESGLQYRIITDGNAETKPGPQDTVYVHYKGTYIDGTEFDATDPEKEPVRLIMNRVIKGWQEGIQLIGEGGRLKPNSTLIFNIKLDKVNKFIPKETEKDKKTK